MTEKEAREKWCPMASSRSVAYVSPDGKTSKQCMFVREGCEDITLLCVASDCACWVQGNDNQGRCGLVRGKNETSI